MGFGQWYKSQKAGVQVAVVSGILVIVGGVVSGVFGIVDVELAKPGTQTSTPAPATPAGSPASSSSVVVISSLQSGAGRLVAFGTYANVQPADQIYLLATFPNHKPVVSDPAVKADAGASAGSWKINSLIGVLPAPPAWRWAVWYCSVPGPKCTLDARQELVAMGLRAPGIIAARAYHGVVRSR